MTWRTLYDDEHIEVSFAESASDLLLVPFDSAHTAERHGPVWGAPLVGKLRCGGLALRSRSLNWFPARSLDAALAAARPVLGGFRRLATYGHSYGAYGAMKHARRLGASLTLAFSPQNPSLWTASQRPIDAATRAALVPFDLTPADLAPRSYVFLDPLETLDAATMRSLAQDGATGCVLVSTYATGHLSLHPFTSTGLIERIARACLADDVAALPQLWARTRRAYQARSVGVALKAAERHPAIATTLFNRDAVRFSPTQTAEFLIALGPAWARAGDQRAARAALEDAGGRVRDDPRLRRKLGEAWATLGAHARAVAGPRP